MARKLSGPMATMDESPIAESIEYRPPTQSQNPNMFAVSIPNFETSAAFVETATKCLAMDFSSPPSPLSAQSRAVCAFVIVSSVVKVFDETMKSVSVASKSTTASAKSVPSTIETKVHIALAVMFQRLIRHHRTQVRSPNSDVHHILNPLAGVSSPFAAAD